MHVGEIELYIYTVTYADPMLLLWCLSHSRMERVQSVTEQLRREVGIERTRVSVSAKQYVKAIDICPLPAMLTQWLLSNMCTVFVYSV